MRKFHNAYVFKALKVGHLAKIEISVSEKYRSLTLSIEWVPQTNLTEWWFSTYWIESNPVKDISLQRNNPANSFNVSRSVPYQVSVINSNQLQWKFDISYVSMVLDLFILAYIIIYAL